MTLQDVLILDGAIEPQLEEINIVGGTAILYTCRDPDKVTENEDTLAVIPYGPEVAVFVVADGAGGLPAGKRASLTAVQALVSSLENALLHDTLLRTAMLNGIEAANAAVLALANGSATTMTVITVEGSTVRAYQVGDSEAIMLGQRGLISLHTTPHSPTGFAVEAGFLDERDALHHADRHLVSNFIGTAEMGIDIGAEIIMKQRDTIVVASDGLTDNVHIAEIVDKARKGPLRYAAAELTALARQRMHFLRSSVPCKPDDLSIIIFRKTVRRRV
jgi:serine/threonine protein phosphatase PrpC